MLNAEYWFGFLYFLLLSCSSLSRCSHLHQVCLIHQYQFWRDDNILINGILYIACRQWLGYIWGCGIKLNHKLSEHFQHWRIVKHSSHQALLPDELDELKLPPTAQTKPTVWIGVMKGSPYWHLYISSVLSSCLILGWIFDLFFFPLNHLLTKPLWYSAEQPAEVHVQWCPSNLPVPALVLGMAVQRQVQTPCTWHDPMRQGEWPRPWASPSA